MPTADLVAIKITYTKLKLRQNQKKETSWARSVFLGNRGTEQSTVFFLNLEITDSLIKKNVKLMNRDELMT